METNISQLYGELKKAIIRPPRYLYDPMDLPTSNAFMERVDITLTNKRNLQIECSLFKPKKRPPKLPCVIYCHGNSGSRMDAIDCIRELVAMKFLVVSFDFSGSGLSQGDYVSLGFYEQVDLEAVVEYLRKEDIVTRIGVWGRSMGAVTAILYSSKDPTIAGLVLDSPFYSLKTLGLQLVSAHTSVPGFVAKIAYRVVRSDIKKMASFDMDKLDVKKPSQKCFMPALIVHGEQDDFVRISHSEDVVKNYAGEKRFLKVEGGHNDARPVFVLNSISFFFRNHLIDPKDFDENNPIPEGLDIDEYFIADETDFLPTFMSFDDTFLEDTQFVDVFPNDTYDDEDMIQRAIEQSLADIQIDPAEGQGFIALDDSPDDGKVNKKKKKKKQR